MLTIAAGSTLAPGAPLGSPGLLFVTVPESKVVKNRLHLDLQVDDPAAELRRLVGLGARVLDEQADWMVLADPEGNEFCLER